MTNHARAAARRPRTGHDGGMVVTRQTTAAQAEGRPSASSPGDGSLSRQFRSRAVHGELQSAIRARASRARTIAVPELLRVFSGQDAVSACLARHSPR